MTMPRTKSEELTLTRTRNGQTEYQYGGYVTRLLWAGTTREQCDTSEVRVWGPASWDPTYYGDGSEIVTAVAAKKGVSECRVGEVWRY